LCCCCFIPIFFHFILLQSKGLIILNKIGRSHPRHWEIYWEMIWSAFYMLGIRICAICYFHLFFCFVLFSSSGTCLFLIETTAFLYPTIIGGSIIQSVFYSYLFTSFSKPNFLSYWCSATVESFSEACLGSCFLQGKSLKLGK
jgi:hypothetical protein